MSAAADGASGVGAGARIGPRAATAVLGSLAGEHSIVVCCGSGGVGKTTTAATFALEAARWGRSACVVTIDPARRLADALGLEGLANTPTPVPGPWPGRLSALMLDSKRTFDDLVDRYADSAEQAERIKANRIYRNLTGSLSGTQEYMAMEKLYELAEEGGFDLVVVDTPPTRNALDFLDAPRRLTRFLENRVFQALMKPTRAGLRVVGVAAQAVLRTISKVAGADIVSDAVAFFQAFEGMEEGFRARAARVRELLADEGTAFVLVAAPRPDSVGEAVHFADKLAESDLSVAALVVNRVQPRFADDATVERAEAALAGVDRDGGAHRELDDLAELVGNLSDLTGATDREEAAFADLAARITPAPVARVPLLSGDVHDVQGLITVADLLFGQGEGPGGPPREAPQGAA